MGGTRTWVIMSRFRHMRVVVHEPREGRGDKRIGKLLRRLKMRGWEWGRRLIILLVWLLLFSSDRRMLVILLVGARGVRRRLWRMGADNGVVRDVIKAGILHFIGIPSIPSPSYP